MSSAETLIETMIDRIANKPNVYFKSQQKDETDLTLDQKRDIVTKLFEDNKQVFIQRYGSHLSAEELNYFDAFEDNREINYVLRDLRNRLLKNKCKSVVKNRRFEAMKRLYKSGHYFSDSEMQFRNPSLFQQMIGQYMTEDEKTSLLDEKCQQNHQNYTFLSFLLEQMDKNEAQEVEEYDSDSDDSEDTEDNESEDNEEKSKCVDESQKRKLREEFIKLMSEQFMSGKDSEFYDYNECDYDMDLDYNDTYERDEEDRYFEDDH